MLLLPLQIQNSESLLERKERTEPIDNKRGTFFHVFPYRKLLCRGICSRVPRKRYDPLKKNIKLIQFLDQRIHLIVTYCSLY